MDTNGVEQVDLNTLGGADTVKVDDLSGTGVTTVNTDLAATPGSSVGDGAADQVIVNATNAQRRDRRRGWQRRSQGDRPRRRGPGHAHRGRERPLEINTLAGTDTVTSASLVAGAIQLFVDGVPVL